MRQNDGNGESSGHARIYQYNEVVNEWIQLGVDLDREVAGDESGDSVALSADGRTAIIGAIFNDENGDNSGHARVYRYISTQGYTIMEQTTTVIDVTATDGLDSEGSGLVYSLSGDDAGLLSISSTGHISFNTAPVFANPLDDDGDNVYEITVTVTDSGGLSTSEDLEITVVPETTITTGPDGELVFQNILGLRSCLCY